MGRLELTKSLLPEHVDKNGIILTRPRLLALVDPAWEDWVNADL